MAQSQEARILSVTNDELTLSAKTDIFTSFLRKNYWNKLEPLAFRESPVLYLDYNDILKHDLQQYLFDEDFSESMQCLNDAVSTILHEVDIDKENKSVPKVRLKNYENDVSLRNLSHVHNGKLVTINAAISKISGEGRLPRLPHGSVKVAPMPLHHQRTF